MSSQKMLTFLTYFVLVINGNRINRFHLFWDTLYLTFSVTITNCDKYLFLLQVLTKRKVKDRKKEKRFQEETSRQERHETTTEQEMKTHA